MMEFQKLIEVRRSVRKYATDKKVTKEELMEFIKMLNDGGYTIAVIEHDMKFVMNSCNRILVLNFGQKICEGTPDQVKSDKQVHEAYFGKGIIAGEAVKVHG